MTVKFHLSTCLKKTVKMNVIPVLFVDYIQIIQRFNPILGNGLLLVDFTILKWSGAEFLIKQGVEKVKVVITYHIGDFSNRLRGKAKKLATFVGGGCNPKRAFQREGRFHPADININGTNKD